MQRLCSFPTFLCGVLVFVSVSRPLLLPSSSADSATSCHTHTILSHTIFVTHNFVTHHFVTHHFVTYNFVTCNFVTRLGDIHWCFAWQAWHSHPPLFCVAGVALGALGWLWSGWAPRHWPVSSRPRDCRTSRPALHCVASEAGFLTNNFGTRNSCMHNSFTRNFLTHNSFTLIHNYSQLPHTQLLHSQLFHPYTSHLSNTHTTLPHTIFFNLSILHHLLCLSFLLCPASTLVSNYWKKLTCGVIRSFNFPIQRQFLAPCFPRIFRIRRLMVIVSTISPAVNLLCNQLRDSNKYRAPYFPMYPYTIPYISLQHHIFFFAPHDFVGQLPTTPLLISSSIKSQFSVG